MRNTIRMLVVALLAVGSQSFLGTNSALARTAISKRLSARGSTSAIGSSTEVKSKLKDGSSYPKNFDELDVSEETLSKFELISSEEVTERGLSAKLFRHRATGAEVLSIDTPNDENKVFSCNFRTLPKDNTGVPHILEHSVLCGSRRYPVKEPFVEMLKGSLKTFLNAMTAPDKTMYPVASQNKQDFFNLVNVYLDACLHPRILDPVLGPEIFKQEGWHYEVSEDPTAPLTYKGVVYNEMKGVYSSPDSFNGRVLKSALFKDHPIYSIDSGGDPDDIPNLSYEQFKAFHDTYYHPSNARLYFYGDERELPTEERLALLEEYLSEFERSPSPIENIPVQPLAKEPYEVISYYPTAEKSTSEPKQFVTLAWLLSEESFDPDTKLAFGILNHLLLGTSSSYLEKALIESGLGASVIGSGYSSSLQQPTFTVGLKGVNVGDEEKEKVTSLIVETLTKISQDGFEASAIEASLNTVEFRLRSSSTSPMKGLSFLMGSLSEWNYGRDPIAPLRFEKSLNALKDKIARREPVFQDLIKNYILSNNHKVTVSLVPKPGMESQVYEEETNRLATAKDSFSAEELASLRKQTVDLKASQALRNSPEELATLPTLSKDDLDRKTKPVPIEELDLGRGATLLTHDLQTDGVVYLDVALDMSRIALNDIPLVPLLTAMMSSLGTKTESEVDFSRRTGAQTGGVGISTFTSAAPESDGSVGERDSMYAYVVLRGRGTREKVKELFSISSEKLTSIDLDARERVLEMLKEAKVGTESSIASSGNSYAANQISSRFTLSAHVAELMGGLSQFETIKQAIQDAESDWPSFRDRLERMRTALLSADGTIVNLSADGASLKDAMDFVPGLISSLPDTSNDVASKWQLPTLDTAQKNEGLMVGSTKVNFVAKGCPIYEPGEKISGSASVVSRYLRTAYLWDKVRVQGGAYGCNLGFSRFDGVAMFSSYRDPNIADTLAAYDGTADFLRSNPISEEELTKAIIGAIGDLDSPQALDSKGYSSMLRWIMGVPEKRRQELRNEVIDTTAADFLAFAERLDAVAAEGSVAVVGSKRSLGDANYALGAGKQLEIREVLE